MRWSTPSRTKICSCRARVQAVLDSTPIRTPRSRRPVSSAERVRVDERRRLPLRRRGRRRRPRRSASPPAAKTSASVPLGARLAAAPPDLLLGRVQQRADALHLVRRHQLGRDPPPAPAVDGHPRGERAAPVEDHRVHRHPDTLTGCPARDCPDRDNVGVSAIAARARPAPARRNPRWVVAEQVADALRQRWGMELQAVGVHGSLAHGDDTRVQRRRHRRGHPEPPRRPRARAPGASTGSSSTSAWSRPRSTCATPAR